LTVSALSLPVLRLKIVSQKYFTVGCVNILATIPSARQFMAFNYEKLFNLDIEGFNDRQTRGSAQSYED
jgi:hypothetical protein